MFIIFVYTLYIIKSCYYYDLSVLSMSVMDFQKRSLDGGGVGGVSSIQFYFWNLFNFAMPIRHALLSQNPYFVEFEFTFNIGICHHAGFVNRTTVV